MQGNRDNSGRQIQNWNWGRKKEGHWKEVSKEEKRNGSQKNEKVKKPRGMKERERAVKGEQRKK